MLIHCVWTTVVRSFNGVFSKNIWIKIVRKRSSLVLSANSGSSERRKRYSKEFFSPHFCSYPVWWEPIFPTIWSYVANFTDQLSLVYKLLSINSKIPEWYNSSIFSPDSGIFLILFDRFSYLEHSFSWTVSRYPFEGSLILQESRERVFYFSLLFPLF